MSAECLESLKKQLVPLFRQQLGMPSTSLKIQNLDSVTIENMKIIRKSMLAESTNLNGKLMKSISDFTDNSLEKHFVKVQNFWHSKQAHALSNNTLFSFINFVEISKMLEPLLVKYAPYPSCMLYLFMAEGVYMNSLRDVLVWKKLSEGCDIQDGLLKLNFHKLCDCLKLEYWTKDYEPHMRNAIAHNNFYILPGRNICCQDVDHSGNIDESVLSLEDLHKNGFCLKIF